MNDKISIKMSSLEILPQKKFGWRLLTKAKKSWQNSYFVYNIFFGRFSSTFVQNRRPYGRQIFQAIFVFGQFCVILQNFRPTGNSEALLCFFPWELRSLPFLSWMYHTHCSIKFFFKVWDHKHTFHHKNSIWA
jgi:hypothetical protein